MNIHTKFPSQQRIEYLVNIGRPLTDEEGEELYRALHADYMVKWRAAKKRNDRERAELARHEPLALNQELLMKVRAEAKPPGALA